MSFRLFSERAQKKISTAKNGLSLSVFVVGLLITGFLADTFYQSELKHQHENLTSQAREFYKIQNLTLNNNILKIQSFNEILNFKSFSDSKQHIFIKEIISNTIFTRASVFAFRKKYDAENLPELTFKTRVKTANDTLPSTLTSKLKSAYVKRKIKYMLDNKLLSSISISNTDGLSTMAFILRADNNSGNFVIFSTTLENFFKDWPSNQNLSAILSDNQAHLNILIQQDTVTKKFLFSVAPEAISATQNKSKLLVYSSFLSNEAYGISINWYQQAVPTPSHYVMMIGGFGLCISALLALFLRFILGQNRRIYKLVLSRTEELEKAMNEAKEANQAKTRFLTNMSHELRTPLNLILGMVEVLQDSGQTEKNKNHLNSMQSAGEHLLNLITDLLSMAKDEDEDAKLHHISFDLPKFFEDIASIVGPECGKKNLDFVLNISDEIPTILLGDAVKVRQIILNLLRNSLRYTNEGSIELRVELFKKSHPNDQTAHVRFQIKDTGIGIPKDKMNLIFDRFFQINKSLDFSNDGGVGLGLSIVKDLVAKMDGNIIVHSEEGKGSDFIVDLDFDCRDEHAWIESFHHTSGERIKNVLFISKKFESLSKIKALLPSSCFQVEEVSAGIIPEVPPQLKDGKNRYVILDELDEQVLTLLTKEFPEKT
ncbi:MAG: sensor histidine kinase, partial [Pseudobdellovibrio sp.]